MTAKAIPVWATFRGLRRTKKVGDETGATLILALIFILVISVIAGSLTAWVTSDLNNTGKFQSALSYESSANSAVELALQNVRYNFAAQTLNAVPPQPCLTSSTSLSQETFTQGAVEAQTVSVWCSTSWSPLSANTRVVTFYVCQSNFSGTPTSAVMNAAATACALNPLLQAVVAFDDYPSTIGASNCSPSSSTTCGTTLTILSWTYGVSPPTVSRVADSTTGCPSSNLVTITGSGLTGATAVSFTVPQATNNAIFSASQVTVVSDTEVTACGASTMTVGSTYQVTVTTPNGTSVPTTVGASSLTY